MAYRNKTYICFDADNDIHYYRLMEAWKENGNIAFDFNNAHELNNLRQGSSEETIKSKLRERMENSKVAIVLIGEHTKDLFKFVRWEIEQAQKMGIPIIVANLNKLKKKDDNLCPAILRNSLALHVAFGQKIINLALNNWPKLHYELTAKGENNDYLYNMSVYKSIYPDFVRDEIYSVDDLAEFNAA